MKKQLTLQQQYKNAVKWLDNLQITTRLKGTGKLKRDKYNASKKHLDILKDEYCCLGSGCRVFRIDPKKENPISEWYSAVSYEFNEKVGIQNYNLIWSINDELYKNDKDFKNVRKHIIVSAQKIFGEILGKKIQKHYKVL